jgi:hypothetical protein
LDVATNGGAMEEKVMEKLMKSYEAEISNPVRSLLFGNLMTAMLIQVTNSATI